MANQIIANKKKGLAKWTTRDLLVTAVISIVFAILLLGATYLYLIFIVPLGPLAMFALNGIWFIPPILIAYILRRPGAALLSQSIISIITVAFSPWGWMELMNILYVGMPVELVFCATRYRNYRLPALMLSSVVTGLVPLPIFWVPLGINLLSIEMQITIIVAAIINAAVAGWLAKLLADAIAKTGVLSSYAIGQERQEEV